MEPECPGSKAVEGWLRCKSCCRKSEACKPQQQHKSRNYPNHRWWLGLSWVLIQRNLGRSMRADCRVGCLCWLVALIRQPMHRKPGDSLNQELCFVHVLGPLEIPAIDSRIVLRGGTEILRAECWGTPTGKAVLPQTRS
jgi:hypothetical protein